MLVMGMNVVEVLPLTAQQWLSSLGHHYEQDRSPVGALHTVARDLSLGE